MKQLFEYTNQQILNSIDIDAELYPHQQDFLKYARTHDRFILSDAQGLGKTLEIMSLAVARKKLCGLKHCLIIVCVNGLKYNWKEEIEKFTNEKAYILGTRVNKKGAEVLKGYKERLEDIRKKPDEFFWITNIETLRYKEGAGRGRYVIAEELAKLCNNGTIGMVAVDEIHKSKNPKAKQTQGLLKLEANCMVAATGTPIVNSPLDCYIPLFWLKKYNHSFYTFRDQYCVMGGYLNKEIVGYKNLPELNLTIQDNMIRRLKQDVLNLPPKIHITEYIELNPEEKAFYKSVLKKTIKKIEDMLAENKKKINVKTILSQWAYLRQITGNANILFPGFNASSKFSRCLELVNEFAENNEKTVIFSGWTSITDRIFPELAKYNPVLITGEVNEIDRQAAVKKFQTDPDCKVIVGTAGALGTGLTLTAGTNVIFLDSPWTSALKEQCEDRCHRIGTKLPVNIITLVAKHTIDEMIEKKVFVKSALSNRILDSDVTDVESHLMIKWLMDEAERLI